MSWLGFFEQIQQICWDRIGRDPVLPEGRGSIRLRELLIRGLQQLEQQRQGFLSARPRRIKTELLDLRFFPCSVSQQGKLIPTVSVLSKVLVCASEMTRRT